MSQRFLEIKGTIQRKKEEVKHFNENEFVPRYLTHNIKFVAIQIKQTFEINLEPQTSQAQVRQNFTLPRS